MKIINNKIIIPRPSATPFKQGESCCGIPLFKGGAERLARWGIFALSFSILIFNFSIPAAYAQSSQTQTLNSNLPPTNINDTGFKLTVCDGPAEANLNHDSKYVPCDFNGAMMQVQHLINIAIVVGVVVAILLFSYAGFLYVTAQGNTTKISTAHGIFIKVLGGFIIMLSAWFIVYQILDWLTGKTGFSALLGNP